ncbi:MAG: bifunctional diaminohydroxyphosphoribosylaminopyrimidine deaminase/5-amino-6-(5-phosphoribosylamino)uracil reductase RibD [Pseudomonadota bacterium]
MSSNSTRDDPKTVGALQGASHAPFDVRMMRTALLVAARGLGRTAPNPAVGAVIANETTGEIISRGWTQPGGRPHAETQAIERAGARARGQTIYVTLEPCSHFGKTAPCADAIIAAGLRRVVVAIEDPDPRVSGRGLDRLREAGIAVTRFVLADEAHASLRGHIVRVTERRPFVQIKMALNDDGQVARGSNGQPVWVTGPLARRFGHMLRAKADAILIGAGTLRDDNPSLTCRLPGLDHRTPQPVVLAGKGPLPAYATLLAPESASGADHSSRLNTILAIPADAQSRNSDSVEEDHPALDMVPLKTVGGQIWLPALAEALVGRGITRLLVEGGPAICQAFLNARMADEVVVFQSLGADGMDAARQRVQNQLNAQTSGINFVCFGQRRLDKDAMFVFQPVAQPDLAP